MPSKRTWLESLTENAVSVEHVPGQYSSLKNLATAFASDSALRQVKIYCVIASDCTSPTSVFVIMKNEFGTSVIFPVLASTWNTVTPTSQ